MAERGRKLDEGAIESIEVDNCCVVSTVECGSSKKKALSRRCKDVGQAWRRKLTVCRSPSVDSNDIGNLSCPNCICTAFRRASSVDGKSAERTAPQSLELESISDSRATTVTHDVPPQNKPQSSIVVATSSLSSAVCDADGILQNSGYSPTFLNNAVSQGNSTQRLCSPQLQASSSQRHKVTTKSASCAGVPNALAGSSSSRRASPLFPCFNPRHSSDSEDREERPGGVGSATPRRNQRIVVTRPAVVATATSSNFVASRQFNAVGGAMVAEPYPIHTQVEYTHCLVPDMVNIINAPYYWGVMDRFQAEKLLENKPEGTFLLRDSSQTEYLFSVSFRRYGRSLHARIEQLNNRFSFDSYDPGVFSSESVTGLIDHYKNPAVCLFFEPQLSLPLRRNFVFPLQHFCRAVITSNLKCYDAIQKLNLPKSLSNFLEEYHYKLPVRVRKVEH